MNAHQPLQQRTILLRLRAMRRVALRVVDHQLGRLHDRRVVVVGMIGGDDHAVVRGQILRRQVDRAHAGIVVVAHLVQLGEIGIVVIERARRARPAIA